MVDLHNNYLDNILDKCFLKGREAKEFTTEKKMQTTLSLIFSQVFKLNHLVKEYGTSICTDKEAKVDVETVTKHFMETSFALYGAVRNMAYKGQHTELFLRLDFNKYFSKAKAGLWYNLKK